ncbi:acetylcholine receptor subunit alpha-like [Argopecten irradians]|uniref:acetylcholine receptor subunit alpha-like n=1 Tax=Argopecten irradians TaxID=31199 RepID=UPI0037187D33
METYLTFTILLAIIGAMVSQKTVEGATWDDVVKLQTDLFANYSAKHRPVSNHSDVLNVTASTYLLNILKLDDVAGVIDISFVLDLQWMDTSLTWTPSSYGGLTSHVVRPVNVWFLKAYILNTAEELEPFTGSDFPVFVNSTGKVSWLTGKLVKSSCDVDITHYPTDTQTCSFIICPWGYPTSEVYLSVIANTIDLKYAKPNGEWAIISTSMQQHTEYEPIVSAIKIDLTIQRKSTYFVVSLLLPIVILILLTSTVFLIPISSGERMGYAISMLLALALYLSLITDSIPKVSKPMAGITYFVTLSLLESSGVLLITLYTLHIDLYESIEAFPSWLIGLHRCYKTFTCKRKSDHQTTKVEEYKTQRDLTVEETDIEKNFDDAKNLDTKRDDDSNDSDNEEEITPLEVKTFFDMFLFIVTTLVGFICIIFYFGGYIKL